MLQVYCLFREIPGAPRESLERLAQQAVVFITLLQNGRDEETATTKHMLEQRHHRAASARELDPLPGSGSHRRPLRSPEMGMLPGACSLTSLASVPQLLLVSLIFWSEWILIPSCKGCWQSAIITSILRWKAGPPPPHEDCQQVRGNQKTQPVSAVLAALTGLWGPPPYPSGPNSVQMLSAGVQLGVCSCIYFPVLLCRWNYIFPSPLPAGFQCIFINERHLCELRRREKVEVIFLGQQSHGAWAHGFGATPLFSVRACSPPRTLHEFCVTT